MTKTETHNPDKLCWTNGCDSEYSVVLELPGIVQPIGYCSIHAKMFDNLPVSENGKEEDKNVE